MYGLYDGCRRAKQVVSGPRLRGLLLEEMVVTSESTERLVGLRNLDRK